MEKTKINLASNGIFPITITKVNGELKPILNLPDTGYNIPGTIQGEGKQLGMPCLFVRTSSCNLRCAWIGADGKGSLCDTPYTSHSPQKNHTEIEDIIDIIKANATISHINHVVVSGGEPTVQDEQLAFLLQRLVEEGFHTTIETNGTIYTKEISKWTNLVSMSPKLSSSTPWQRNLKETGVEFNQKWADRHERDRKNIKAIQGYINDCYESIKDLTPVDYVNYKERLPTRDFQLKFVITDLADIEEIEKDFLAHLKGVMPTDICLMPEGVTAEDLMAKSTWVAKEAIQRGWRFTPRLHALLWGVKIGV